MNFKNLDNLNFILVDDIVHTYRKGHDLPSDKPLSDHEKVVNKLLEEIDNYKNDIERIRQFTSNEIRKQGEYFCLDTTLCMVMDKIIKIEEEADERNGKVRG